VISGSGPPDSPQDRSDYALHLKKLGLLETFAADMRERYLKSQYLPRPSLVKPEDYHDSFTTGAAVDFIRGQPKEKPLCLVVSLHSPHPPLDAPGEYATMFDPEKLTLPANVPDKYLREGQAFNHAKTKAMLANYLGKIALVDHCISRLVDALKARGTWDEALFFLTADHGEMMGAHGTMSKGRFFEESVRVPLVMRWPGHVKNGRTPALAQMMDVYPTIVDAIGGEVTSGRFAKSLLPIAAGKAGAVRDVAISEIGTKAPLDVMVRDSRFKYWADSQKEHLFDLQNDPLEMRDLVADAEHQETLSNMRAKLILHLRSTQLNYSEGYVGKVRRLRQQEEETANGAPPRTKKRTLE
jgi:arylsulfatase A-like enzyme